MKTTKQEECEHNLIPKTPHKSITYQICTKCGLMIEDEVQRPPSNDEHVPFCNGGQPSPLQRRVNRAQRAGENQIESIHRAMNRFMRIQIRTGRRVKVNILQGHYMNRRAQRHDL